MIFHTFYKVAVPNNGLLPQLLRVMRITAILILVALLQVSAASRAQNITIVKNNISLTEIFKEIRKQTGYNILWQPDKIDAAKKIDLKIRNQDLDKVLIQVLKDQNLSYTIEDRTIRIKYEETSYLDKIIARFQKIDVSGKILDEKGEPLAGATVAIKGSGRSVKTNEKGVFHLQNVGEKDKLLISYIGYQTREVNAASEMGSLTMSIADAKLDEVMINAGYYTVKESERTGNIARISSKEIETQPVTNILATMQGRMAGVNITQNSGIPGESFSIEIRGRNSIRDDGNTPLYIIDGMPYPTQRIDMLSGMLMGKGASPLNGINPVDIESIEVLKDADATAIYGSRGANGVVLITTKKGKESETEFTFNAYGGIGKVTRNYSLMNTKQYLEMRREAFVNDGLTTSSPEYGFAYDINGTWDPNKNTNWQKEFIGGSARTYNVQGGVSGGNKTTQYLFSGNYSKENTVFPGNFHYQKGSGHFNTNHNSNDGKFKMSLSGSYVIDNNNQPNVDLSAKITLPPNHPALYKENGELNWENVFNNPLAALESKFLMKNNTLTVSSNLSYNILPELEFKTVLGFIDGRMTESITSPSTMYNPAYGYDSSISSYSLNNGTRQSWSIEPQVSWSKGIGKGILSILVGTTFQKSTSSQLYNSGYGFASNSQIQNISAAANKDVYSSNSEYRYNAVFGRVNYNLAEKYIINLTARRDGSSRFGPGKRFGNFGAAGVAWLFGKEAFVNQLMPILSFGKLRTSYGTSGNDQIGDYQFLNTYTSSNINYQGIVGLQPTSLYNPDFSWETNKKMEMAIDLGFFDDKLFFSTAYFRNRSSNQLVGIPLPGTTGFTSIQANLNATVQNTGWEFEFRTSNLRGKKIRWSTSLNFSIPRNKLISFPGLTGSTYAYNYIIGQPLNIRKAYHYTGVDNQTGVYTYLDANGDGQKSFQEDAQTIIDLSPAFFGGLTNNLTYKDFELDLLFQFVKKQGLNYMGSWPHVPGEMGNQPIEVLNRWQKPDDNKPIQRYTAGYGAAYNAYWSLSGSDSSLSDASFIRLKNISLTYNMRFAADKASSCRFFLQAQNLFTITKYKGADPESQLASVLPPLQTITAGIRLNY